MDQIYEAYGKVIYEMNVKHYDPWMNKTDKLLADIGMKMFDIRNAKASDLNPHWKQMAGLVNLKSKDLQDSEVKKFLSDLEKVGMDLTDNERHFSAKMLKQHMSKWLV